MLHAMLLALFCFPFFAVSLLFVSLLFAPRSLARLLQLLIAKQRSLFRSGPGRKGGYFSEAGRL